MITDVIYSSKESADDSQVTTGSKEEFLRIMVRMPGSSLCLKSVVRSCLCSWSEQAMCYVIMFLTIYSNTIVLSHQCLLVSTS